MTTNDTRTPRERAEELAAGRWEPGDHPLYKPHRAEFVAGFLARDAEPTTVSALQIEAAACELGYSIGWLDRNEEHNSKPSDMFEDEAQKLRNSVKKQLRAAGFRIDGDPA